MRKSREILDYRWQEMTVIASDTHEDVMDVDAYSADAGQASAEMQASNNTENAQRE